MRAAAILALAVVAFTPAWAQSIDILALKGHDSIRVVVGGLDHDATGLDSTTVRTKVELELRKARVRVGPGFPERTTIPYLWVAVDAITTSSGVVAFTLRLALAEVGGVDPHSKATSRLLLWERGTIGTAAPASDAAGFIMARLELLLEGFMNDFLAANPR